MERTNQETLRSGRAIVVMLAALVLSFALTATAWAVTNTAQGYNDTTLKRASLSSSSGTYEITVNGQTDARLYLNLTSTSGTETYISATDVFRAPSGCGYCWDSNGCGVEGICPDAWGYCACYSSPVDCGVQYDLVASNSTEASVISQCSNSIATVTVVGGGFDGTDSLRIVPTGNGTGPFTVYVRARTAAPNPDDMLGDGSGCGPNAYGRQSVEAITINVQ